MRAIQAAAGDAPSVAAKAVAALDDCSPATATTNTDNYRRLVAAGLRILTA